VSFRDWVTGSIPQRPHHLNFAPMATRVAEQIGAEPSAPWTIEDSRTLYNVEGWGIGFFDINDRGHVVVRPDKSRPDRELDLYELATDLAEQGVTLPLLLRFSDILRSRVETLSGR